MLEDARHALAAVAEQGDRLITEWRFKWTAQQQQAVHRLRIPPPELDELTLCAVVGGASSGKSTVFDNLMGGRLASRVTARGHATLGPILAVHESKRDRVQRLSDEGLLLPDLAQRGANLDDNVIGDPEALITIYHDVDELAGVLLFDTPDFTSEVARREGDISLALLPWFDRLIVVIDHERWFDRQTISQLKQHSARFGHERIALFNRTQEGELAEADRRLLEIQAERLGADRAVILEFRRGRGFCHFAPGTLDDVGSFLQRRLSSRTSRLWAFVADGADRVLSQNEERAVRLTRLEEAMEESVARTLPTPWDCMTAMMNSTEREQMNVVSRVLRIKQTRQWLVDQRRRMEGVLRHVPVVGVIVGPSRGRAGRSGESEDEKSDDRHELARSYFEKTAKRQAHDLQRVARTSRFWDEVRRWTGIEPAPVGFVWDDAVRGRVDDATRQFDAALKQWNQKVEAECEGVAPNVMGAAGAGAIGLAVVLIAVQGPVGALTLPAASGAIWASIGKLAAVAGTGAVVGKQAGRLAAVVRERLIGCVEYNDVKQAAARFVQVIENCGRRIARTHVDQAKALVIEKNHPLVVALERLRNAQEAIA